MPLFVRSYRFALFGVVCVMAAFSGVSPVQAQSISDARGLWFDADFEASRDAFTHVLASPSLTTPDALDAHRFLAALLLVLEDEAGARAHAEAALALDADVVPPEGAPSSAAGLFRMARRRLGGREAALTLEASGPARYGANVSVIARLDPAPSALVRSITIRCGDEEASGAVPSVTLPLEARDDVTCVAHARTEGGAPLLEAELTLEVTGRPVVVARAEGEPTRDTSHRARNWAIAGAVVALAVGGTVTAVVIRDRNNGDVRFAGTTVVGW